MLIPVWSDILSQSTIWCWYRFDQAFYVKASPDADTGFIRHFKSKYHLMLIPVWSDILCHSVILCWYPFDQTFYVTASSHADTRLIRHFTSKHHLMLIPVWSDILCQSTIWYRYPFDQKRKSRIAPLHFSNFSILCKFLILSELLHSSHLSPLVSVVLSVCLSRWDWGFSRIRGNKVQGFTAYRDAWVESLTSILQPTKVLRGQQPRSHWFKSTDRLEIWNTPALDYHLQVAAVVIKQNMYRPLRPCRVTTEAAVRHSVRYGVPSNQGSMSFSSFSSPYHLGCPLRAEAVF